jgi:exportin-2 (importin alpha re-exporter)
MFSALLRLFQEPKYFKEKDAGSQDPYYGITEVDYEEQNAGYQAAYSRLAASESVPVDPVAYAADPKEYLAQQILGLYKSEPRLKRLLAAADPTVAGPFLESLGLVM